MRPWRAWRPGNMFLSQPPISQQPVMLWGVCRRFRSNRAITSRNTQRIFSSLPGAHRDAVPPDGGWVPNVCGMAGPPLFRAATTARSVKALRPCCRRDRAVPLGCQ